MNFTKNEQRIGEIVLGLLIAGIGLVVFLDAYNMSVLPYLAAVGPKAFPYAISSGLMLIGAKLIWDGVRGTVAFEGGLEFDYLPVVLISGGFILVMLTIKLFGWIPAATALFMIGAFAFRDRQYLRALIYGLCLAGLTVLIFNYTLGLKLPMGEIFDLAPKQ